MSLLIKNCRLESNGRTIERNILVEDGRIKAITGQQPSADETLDAHGQFAIPGLIDCHVHFREPGLNHKEDWTTGSYAAAAGGVTTVLDMPNTRPPTLTKKLLNEKRHYAKKSIVNYGFHFGASENNSTEIKKVQKEIASTKLYMNQTTGGLMVTSPPIMKDVFQSSKRVTVHAEGNSVLHAMGMARQTKTPLHLAHVRAEEMFYLGQNKPFSVSTEATPHHLFLDTSNSKNFGPFGMMKPKLTSKKERENLWHSIDNGLIDAIATDHAPHTREEKERSAPFGVPGLETMLPLLLDAMSKGRITLTKIAELTSKNPARIFNIKNKGNLAPGYDADITLINPKTKKRVSDEHLFTKCGWSPFNRWILKGWPTTTIVKGHLIFKDGEIIPHRAQEVRYGV